MFFSKIKNEAKRKKEWNFLNEKHKIISSIEFSNFIAHWKTLLQRLLALHVSYSRLLIFFHWFSVLVFPFHSFHFMNFSHFILVFAIHIFSAKNIAMRLQLKFLYRLEYFCNIVVRDLWMFGNWSRKNIIIWLLSSNNRTKYLFSFISRFETIEFPVSWGRLSCRQNELHHILSMR